VKSLASDARRRAADLERVRREARNSRIKSYSSNSSSSSSSSSSNSSSSSSNIAGKNASNLRAPRWPGRWEEEDSASMLRSLEGVGWEEEDSTSMLRSLEGVGGKAAAVASSWKPSASKQPSTGGSTVYSGVLYDGHEGSSTSSSSSISRGKEHHNKDYEGSKCIDRDYSDLEAGSKSDAESSSANESGDDESGSGTIEKRKRLSLVEEMAPMDRAVFLSEVWIIM